MQDEIKDTFEYQDGKLYWKIAPKYAPYLRGKEAGSVHKTGYRCVNWRKVHCKVHKLIWILFFGDIESDCVIDHKDGNKLNNSIENLRVVSVKENRQNMKQAQCNNQLGMLGVQKRGNKFRARIRVNGNLISIGLFDSAEAAQVAYFKAKELNHEGFIL